MKGGLFRICSGMDVLKPQIINIDGRRYRKMPYLVNGKSFNSSEAQSHGAGTYWEDEECDDQESLQVEKTEKGYTTQCSDIPSFYFKFICGKKNENKNRIERETKVHISIPRPGIEGDIVISGHDKNSVLSAKTRIELIVDSARARQRPTHFISIPLARKNTLARFEEFKQIALDQCSQCKGFDEKIIQIPEKLHLTLGMMVLMSDKEIVQAGNYLKNLKGEIDRLIGKSPLHVVLEGVECMNDDPAEVAVLYAKVKLADGSQRLQRMVEFIVDSFVSKRMMRREYDKVKLHATVINTKFKDVFEENSASGPMASRHDPRQGKNKSVFDARKIMELCGNFNFGDVPISSIHLSKRGSFGPDGGYHCEASIDV